MSSNRYISDQNAPAQIHQDCPAGRLSVFGRRSKKSKPMVLDPRMFNPQYRAILDTLRKDGYNRNPSKIEVSAQEWEEMKRRYNEWHNTTQQSKPGPSNPTQSINNNVQTSPVHGGEVDECVRENALLPHFPVLTGFSQLYFAVNDYGVTECKALPTVLVSDPQVTHWWVYGEPESLCNLKRLYEQEARFIAELSRQPIHSWIAFKLHEWNPDVSLSYLWGYGGYARYALNEIGQLSGGYAPNQVELTQGYKDMIDDESIEFEE